MRLDELRSALEETALAVPPPRAPNDAVIAELRTRDRRRRRIRFATVVAIALVVALGASGLTVLVRGSSSDRRVVAGAGESATAAVHGFTAEQLRAHDGIGAPAGWVPVDAGDVRLFVPSDWYIEEPGWCIGGPSKIVAIGQPPHSHCNGSSGSPPTDSVTLMPSGVTPNAVGSASRSINGYTVFDANPDGPAGVTVAQVPALRVVITLTGQLRDQILGTLAPSARSVALAVAVRHFPAGHVVRTDGIAMTVPPSWPLETARFIGCGFNASGRAAVLRITADVDIPACPPPVPTAENQVDEGVHLYTVDNTIRPTPSGAPVKVLHHRSTVVRVYDGSEPGTLDVFVQRRGSRQIHYLTVGLGTNGRIAGRVLASLRATS